MQRVKYPTAIQKKKLKDQRAYMTPEMRARQSALGKARKVVIKKQLIERLGGSCVCCGITEWWVLTFDHIKPLRENMPKYHSDWWQQLKNCPDLSHIQLMCSGCNSSKGIDKECKLEH